VPLAGRPMVEWSIAAFRACASVRSIVVACPPGHAHELVGEDIRVVEGGATRSRSVANALAAIDTALVAIHDAARPLLTPRLVEDVVATVAADPGADGAIAAVLLTDTVKQTRSERSGRLEPLEAGRAPFTTHEVANGARVIEKTLDRSQLWAAQTPQVFRTAALRRALDAHPPARPPATDEAMLVEAAGGRVLIHPSAPDNVKVTTPFDLRVAELLLMDRAAR
jgi:2-C-methyl-D-erythritol 4-phosphate cytidylyltransferase